jgi:hypothetical protein
MGGSRAQRGERRLVQNKAWESCFLCALRNDKTTEAIDSKKSRPPMRMVCRASERAHTSGR